MTDIQDEMPDPQRYPGKPLWQVIDTRQYCLVHLEPEPCSTCASYIAAGL